MQTELVRTTILLQPSLFRRLKLFAHDQGKPMTEVVERAIRTVIETEDQPRIQRMYDGLFRLAGTGKAGVRDASSTIDDDLYGEDGAWKGADA